MIDHARLKDNHNDFLRHVGLPPSSAGVVVDAVHQGLPAVECRSWDALVRAVGHYKYRRGAEVLMRGQVSPTSTMKPSIYRHARAGVDLDSLLNDFVAHYGKRVKKETAIQAMSTEPLLQHYGIRTRWLDVVDSIPHALFFATHEFVQSPFDASTRTYVPAVGAVGFIYLIEVAFGDPVRDPDGTAASGMWWTGDGARICDLRQAKPSKALRPHAQHGLLVRPKAGVDNLDEHVVARLAVPVREARAWLGGGTSLTREGLFPPPGWDAVYATLLEKKATQAISEFSTANASSGGDLIGSVTRFDFVASP